MLRDGTSSRHAEARRLRLFAFDIKMFFLGCVLVAALYGGYSVSRRILLIQGLPALIALAVTIAFANPYLEVTDCCKPAAETTATTTP